MRIPVPALSFLLLVASTATRTTTAFAPRHHHHHRRAVAAASSRMYAAAADTSSKEQQEQNQQQQQQRTAVNAAELAEEEAFLQQCAKLCEERNLKFDAVKNARDLASVETSRVLPGRIYRMGRVSDASDADIELLLQTLNITTLVDLRSPTELKDDPTLMRDAVFGNFTDILWKEQGRNKDGCLVELPKGQPPVKPRRKKKHHHFWNRNKGRSSSAERIALTFDDDDDDDDNHDEVVPEEEPVTAAAEATVDDEECGWDCGPPSDVSQAHRKERHFVSLMNEFKYVKGTVSKLRKRDLTKAILKSPGAMFSRRMRDSLKKPFLDEINDGGLPMLNELLLRFGAPGIKYVLELCADKDRHPIAFYCTAGKDRTGMIAAIILGLTGVKESDIVEDYTLSANVYAEMNDHQAMVGALSQRNLDPKTFLGAPASVMRDTLQAINENYGSVEGYCDWIGFDAEQREKLRKACME